MTEKLLQYIWQFQYFNQAQLATTNGEPLQIIHPGCLNQHQGPDFTQAHIRLGNARVVGSVELHLKTSDWEKHKHSGDPHYNNVILHVVHIHDKEDTSGLPLLVLEDRIPHILLSEYNALMNHQAFIACHSSIGQTKELTWVSWKERLVAERLMRKGNYILELLQQSGGHWEEAFWWLLARTFGMKLNGDFFESIARSLPISILARHKQTIQTLEALLLGQAGFLEGDFTEAYPKLLQREYVFYKKKYALPKVHGEPVFLRMRPVNFPTVRLAQLAMLVHTVTHFFATIKEKDSLDEVKKLLNITANDYWHSHYRLDEPSAYMPKKIGVAMMDNLTINAMVPVLFAYGHYVQQDHYKQKAIKWLEETSQEKNNITTGFNALSMQSRSAFDSQAFIELKNQYCDNKRCLECSVGVALLRKNASP